MSNYQNSQHDLCDFDPDVFKTFHHAQNDSQLLQVLKSEQPDRHDENTLPHVRVVIAT